VRLAERPVVLRSKTTTSEAFCRNPRNENFNFARRHQKSDFAGRHHRPKKHEKIFLPQCGMEQGFIMGLIALLFFSTLAIPFAAVHFKKSRGKIALAVNLVSFVCVFVFATIWVFGSRAYGIDDAEGASELALAAAFIGAGIVTGLGAIGTGIAVSSAAAAAIGAISENENNFGKAMIFVAMAEGIAIYGLLISFMILGRV